MVPEYRLTPGPLFLALASLALLPLSAQAMDPDDPDYDPFEDDSLWGETVSPDETQTTSPDLKFLTEEPEKVPHHHQNQITLSQSSLEDGWVELRQCHNDITPIRRMVIVYNEERIDDLQVESTTNIDRAEALGDRVDLRGVEKGSEVCITARMRVIEHEGDGIYKMENGPFVRRFLDGYFPMRVTMAVNWGDLDLRLEDTRPEAQDGFEVVESDHGIILDTLFEGELRTQVRLRNAE
ncbi:MULTISPECIES: hypothetical protein [unclassified Thioalkalivibrio]|uniref:hypothetical protein n=1 Tax=unclassified Thioalkalivibrio TaxID=2621013 RepID=UPI0004781FB8|nr:MULTISPECIES: hypothetical protein [unclassified Thioalkalivibrio]